MLQVQHQNITPASGDVELHESAPIVGGVGKRAFDIVASLAGLVFIAPVLLALAIAVRLTSRGPILFWSMRVGRGGRAFMMPKFRTMRVDAPLVAREALVGTRNLLTPIGGWVRRTSLDELPQLYCVLIGEMSLIGPRPLLPSDPASAARLARPAAMAARPGITGLAQVRGRNFVEPLKKVRYDQAYAEHWCWPLDLKILVDTVRYVVTGRGVM